MSEIMAHPGPNVGSQRGSRGTIRVERLRIRPRVQQSASVSEHMGHQPPGAAVPCTSTYFNYPLPKKRYK